MGMGGGCTYIMGKHSSPFRLLYDRSFATVAARGV